MFFFFFFELDGIALLLLTARVSEACTCLSTLLAAYLCTPSLVTFTRLLFRY